VDRVVEPQPERDLGRALAHRPEPIERGEALVEVLQRLMGAVRLAMARDQLGERVARRRRPERAPARLPTSVPIGLQRRLRRGASSLAATQSGRCHQLTSQ
jgi:hypothetical protein